MAIQLSAETERQIEELVRSGRFASAEDFVRVSISRARAAQEAYEKRREEVRQLVAEGTAALERGDYVDYDDESLKTLAEEIKREGRAARALPRAS
jgi:Arc/MetJ-type ribon-helix-helix transcriptional regulator